METSGNLIPAGAELSSCMEHGKDHLHRRKPGLLVDAHRDTPAVIGDHRRAVRFQNHLNIMTISRQMLVHGIIHNLINQMIQSLGRHTSYVHSRTFTDGLQPFQNRYTVRIICLLIHEKTSSSCYTYFFISNLLPARLSDDRLSVCGRVSGNDSQFL